MADAFNERQGRPLQYQGSGGVRYAITLNRPEPLEARRTPIHDEHYVAKQLQPIADSILKPLGESFAALVSPQGGVF